MARAINGYFIESLSARVGGHNKCICVSRMKRLSRKGKLLQKVVDQAEVEKRMMVESLVKKTGQNEQEVISAYEQFHQEHKDGCIPNKEYINSTEVKKGGKALINSMLGLFKSKSPGKSFRRGQQRNSQLL